MAKIIFLVGGCGLIGRVFAERLVLDANKVVIADISAESGKVFVNSLNEKMKDSAFFTLIDITDKGSIKKALESSLEHFGHIDTVVNNAYPRNKNYGRSFFDVDYVDFAQNISMNLGGLFLTSQVFANYFLEQKKGNIINVASIYGVIAPRFEIYNDTKMTMPVEYAAIKSAVIHLTSYMAKYFKGTGTRVNCLSPGGVFDNQDEKFVKSYNQYCMSQGMLFPGDLYGSLRFLISDDSSFVNGQNIIVDDGFTL
jgi:NAD(P)-dependent dehydrogenase (short-subunit alcohol dehydrogenase family)